MQKYSPEELFDILKNVVSNKTTHKHYKRTTELAKLYRQIMTGEDQDELIISYKVRETTEQKTQRVKLYNSRTAYVANKVVSQYKEVERTDNIVDNIWYENDGDNTKNLLKELNDRLSHYSGTKDVKRYLHDAVRRLNFFDPNAWIVTEFRYKDPKEKPYPYPIEIYSNNAVMYEKDFGVTQYLVGKWPIKVTEAEGYETKKERDGSKYTIYGAEVAYTFTEAGEKGKAMIMPGAEYITIEVDKKAILFIVERFETKFMEVPAIQVGYKSDPNTDWQTFVSPLEPAMHIIRDLINTKSEYDLHKALHGFAQKFVFADKCTFRAQISNGPADICDNGILRHSQAQCPACKGTGKQIHTTVQDMVVVKKPEDGEGTFVKLAEMVHYVEIPQHIIEMHKQDLKDLENDVSLAIFNANVFDRAEVAVTATEKRLNMQSVYNELADFAECWAEIYVKNVKLSANVIDGLMGLIVECSIPKDYRMESVVEILSNRKLAIESGAPYDIINTFDMSVLMKQNQDNKIYIDQIKAQEQFRPFRDKAKEEIIYIMTSLSEYDPDKILYMFFDKIFTKIWADPALQKFHKMKFVAQKTIIDNEVNIIIEEKQALSTDITGIKVDMNNTPTDQNSTNTDQNSTNTDQNNNTTDQNPPIDTPPNDTVQ
jgi:hypothetical protein